MNKTPPGNYKDPNHGAERVTETRLKSKNMSPDLDQNGPLRAIFEQGFFQIRFTQSFKVRGVGVGTAKT